jgi:hypothetical protein
MGAMKSGIDMRRSIGPKRPPGDDENGEGILFSAAGVVEIWCFSSRTGRVRRARDHSGTGTPVALDFKCANQGIVRSSPASCSGSPGTPRARRCTPPFVADDHVAAQVHKGLDAHAALEGSQPGSVSLTVRFFFPLLSQTRSQGLARHPRSTSPNAGPDPTPARLPGPNHPNCFGV